MSAYAKRVAIAPGFNNLAGLTQLHKLQTDYFLNYKTWVNLEFTPYEARELSLSRKYKRFGLPSCVWIFEALYSTEFQFLMSTYIGDGFDTGLVTIRTLDTELDSWFNYNALIERPTLAPDNWNGYEYRNIRLNFYDLKKIS